jgi:hypothetical protein
MKTSKLLIVVSVLAGLAAIFMGRFENANAAACFGGILVVVAFNRYHSRSKSYTFSVKGPGGLEAKLHTTDATAPKEPPQDETPQ